MNLTRRDFLKLLGGLSLGSGAASLGGYQYATRVEPRWIRIERVRVPLANLPAALEGLSIAQLSDIHLHPHTQIELVKEAVDIVNQLQADLIVLTGDYVLESAKSVFELAPVLAGMQSRLGTFAILGNHDLWTDAGIVRSGLERAGVPVLVNQGMRLDTGSGGNLFLAGLDDGWSGTPRLDIALAECPANCPAILLMHEPDFADNYLRDNRVWLQLSGHTHGGQVRIPGLGAIALPTYGQKYVNGLYRVHDAWLYVNRGLGVIGPPVRFNCRPEITLITLAST